MLIGLDEHPLHQIAQSFAGVAGSDSQWNDGHYVCLCDVDGNVCLTSNVRLYQNNDVLDGFVCIRHEGRQHNIRLSRRLRPDMDHYGVGPLRIEIVEPMRTLRFVLDENEFDISCDVLCTSTVLPYEDPVEITRVDGRLLSERATYELVGVCDGWVEVAGKRYELTATTSSFFRNHSWGNQAGRGGPRYGAPRPRRRVPGVRQWVLFHGDSHGGFYFIDPSGRAASGKGAILLPDRSIAVTDVEHDLEFYDGGRRVRRGTYRLTDADGDAAGVLVQRPRLGVLPGRRVLRRVRRRPRPGRLPRRPSRRGRGLGREPPDDHRRRGRYLVRVRPRLGGELRPPAVRRRDRTRPLRVRRHPRAGVMSDRLAGQVAVVTGAASGIGAAIAERFVEEGARCVLVDIQDDAGREMAGRLGDAATYVHGDVSVEDDVAAAVEAAVARHGRLDCVVNNAGILGALGPIAEIDAAAWRRTMAVLLDSVFYGIKHAARVMIESGNGGSIVNIASTAGVRAGLGPHVYTAAKHGVVGLTQSVAPELGRHGIRVNAIAPGGTVTSLTAYVTTGDAADLEEASKRVGKGATIGRPAVPVDIANAALFLASAEASYISGSVLVVDAASEVIGDKNLRFVDMGAQIVHEAGRTGP